MNASAATRLCRAHLQSLGAADATPLADATSLADVVWLALQLAARGAAEGETPAAAIAREAADGLAHAPPAPAGQDDRQGPPPGGSAGRDAGDQSVPLYAAHLGHGAGTVAASFVSVPAGEALPQRLALERALRPFKRRLPSRQQRELDPVATAEASADWDAITPVYRATPERWFDVAILAEATDAMQAWDTTLVELRRTLARHGAFRGARLWHYTIRNGAVVLATHGNALASPRLLVDPQGRRLCWFVTTGTSPMWRHAALAELVDILGRHGPTAIVQLMPPHAWPHTLLGDASEDAVARVPGLPTSRLHLRHPFTGELERAPDAWTVPVTTLEPAGMAAWARFAMATRQVSHPALRLPAPVTGMVPAPQATAVSPPPGQRIAAFRANASPQAFQLLRLLSGMPLSLPIMRLMQMGMADRAQVHLAEILLSGLIERVSPADAAIPAEQVEYDFAPGVRAELLDSLSIGEENRIDTSLQLIADQARRYVETHAGGADRAFAALAPDTAGQERLLQHARAFLRVGRDFRPLRDRAAHANEENDEDLAAAPVARPAALEQPAAYPVQPVEDPAWPAAGTFLSEVQVRQHVLALYPATGDAGLRCLLVFSTRKQHTWLVASDDLLHFVLDDENTRRKGRLLQRTVSWLDALPVAVEAVAADHGVVRFGHGESRGWYYSPSLFGPESELRTRILDLLPGGRHGPLIQQMELARKYERIRADLSPGGTRTRALQGVVIDMTSIAPLSKALVDRAVQKDSPGIQLLAIVNLQRRFDTAHIDWLFGQVRRAHAFLGYQAARALYNAAAAGRIDEPSRLHRKVEETREHLLAARLDDEGIHRVLDDIAALCQPVEAVPAEAAAAESCRIFLCGVPGSHGGNRARIAEVLVRHGHEVLEEPVRRDTPFVRESSGRMESSDLVVLVVDREFGLTIFDLKQNPENLPLQELQYDQATRLGKPVLVFIQREWFHLLDTTARKQFRDKSFHHEAVHFFQDSDALEAIVLQAVRDARIERDTAPALMTILVCGTVRPEPELPGNIRRACRLLGESLATHGFGLVTGIWQGVNRMTARHFAARLGEMGVPLAQRLRQVAEEGTVAQFEAGTIARVPAGQVLEQLAAQAQAVVAIGGRGGTATAVRVAASRGALVLPLGYTGGTAAHLYEELRARHLAPAPEPDGAAAMPGFANLRLSDSELRALGESDGAAAAVDILLRIRAERRDALEGKPWPGPA